MNNNVGLDLSNTVEYEKRGTITQQMGESDRKETLALVLWIWAPDLLLHLANSC